VSSAAHVAVLPAGGRERTRTLPRSEPHARRPTIRLATFAALALYGVLRWATLAHPAPAGRLAGMLAAAVVLGGIGIALDRKQALIVALALLALFVMLALAGIPVRWLTHLRVAVSANAVGQGLSGLPGVLLPYLGINQWIRMVMLLGAGLLLLAASLTLALSPRTLSELRRMLVALPLIALAIVPDTLVRPHQPYLQGLVLFVLLAAFMWGERIRAGDLAAAALLVGLAGGAGVIAAPGLDQHKPWVDYEALAGGLAPANVESFDWSQRYGPLAWPRTGNEVLDVKAIRPDYWKAENLDVFDGRGWIEGEVSGGEAEPRPTAAALMRWTQTLQVTVRGMRTSDVVGAGESAAPTDVSEPVVRGISPGTWTAGADLVPGDSYLVTSYSPQPSAAQLATAGGGYSTVALEGYRAILLPQSRVANIQQEIIFPPFHSRRAPLPASPIPGETSLGMLDSSPYARAYALARRLAAAAPTAYAFVASVERYLAHGFTYDENPPTRSYPLASFLFSDKRGYCQQFAGAMALLLRMGGIPARVAAGFTTGTYDRTTHAWVVTDQDAHSWVEAWFPEYGWVKFDPTPAAAPARGGQVPLPAIRGGKAATPRPRIVHHELSSATSSPAARRANHGSGSSALLVALALVAVLALALAALALPITRRGEDATPDELLKELERALRRTGRPVGDGVTLAELERRFRTSPGAEAYVRAIRLSRFAGTSARPTAAQRRALRSQLSAGLGMLGALRALWALPPRAPGAPLRRVGGLHSR